MRKLFVILLLAVTTSGLLSQARVGNTYSEIKKEFKSSGIENIPTHNGHKLLGFKMRKDLTVLYYFINDTCITTIIHITDEALATDVINMYDKAFICVNSKTWKSVTPKREFIINFNYNVKEDYYSFIWK